MAKFIATVSLIGLLGYTVYAYEKAKAEYDPNAICEKQKDVSKEQCLSAINYAMSAGW